MRKIILLLILLLSSVNLNAQDNGWIINKDINIPPGFVDYIVPGHDQQMKSIRDLYYLHYGWKDFYATLWDVYMPMSIIWADTGCDSRYQDYKNGIRKVLTDGRYIDAEGYVSSHMGGGMGHIGGWPFPLWTQSQGIGWQFSYTGIVYREKHGIHTTTNIDGWIIEAEQLN